MSARAETLAKQYEAQAAELTAAIEKLTDADWKKVTTAEKWSVGVTAHHVAGAHEGIAGIVKTVASGQATPPFTMAMLDEMNAKHAKDFANCTKARDARGPQERVLPPPRPPCARCPTPSWTAAGRS